MNVSEIVIIKELMWEYNYTQKQAEIIVSCYKDQGKLHELSDLIQHKLSLRLSEEELCNVQ